MSAVVQQFDHVSRRKKYSNDPLKSTLPHFIPMGTEHSNSMGLSFRGIVRKAINLQQFVSFLFLQIVKAKSCLKS